MTNIFVIADTHFGHEKTCTEFKRSDGSPLRPFSSVKEMDEYMIEQWNATVRAKDKVYHLGDVVINRKNLKTLALLNGDKVLIKGNHDIFKLQDYSAYFRDIRSYVLQAGHVLSHVPIHPASLERWKANIHGHLHANRVLDIRGKIDPRYYCVSVEHTNYTPVAIEDVFAAIKDEFQMYKDLYLKEML